MLKHFTVALLFISNNLLLCHIITYAFPSREIK